MTEPHLIIEREADGQLDTRELSLFVEQISDSKGLPELSRGVALASVYEPSFYPGSELVVLSNPSWRPINARLYFLRNGSTVYRLDGTSSPIHEFNAKNELVLTQSSVRSYLAFFCFFVRSAEGPFFVIDRIDSDLIPAEESVKRAIQESFRPPRLWGQDTSGDWRASALIYYSNALFVSDFLIHLSGMIEMVDDTPVLADLGNKISAPLNVDGFEEQVLAPLHQRSSFFDLARWLPGSLRRAN